jgi:hypothetical protein
MPSISGSGKDKRGQPRADVRRAHPQLPTTPFVGTGDRAIPSPAGRALADQIEKG